LATAGSAYRLLVVTPGLTTPPRLRSLFRVTSDARRPLPEDHFGEDVATRYDDSSDPQFHPDVIDQTVDLLIELVGDGAALEFAIGTGRIALPLLLRGVPVSGIELSPAMIERLYAKQGGQQIDVTIGDMTTSKVNGCFQLVYLVYNTIGNLLTQDEQIACFANAGDHLDPGGHFVVEVGVPDLRRLPPGEDTRVFSHGPGYVGYDHYTDLADQQAVSHHVFGDETGTREVTTPFRYVWPSELDLMARLAGLELAHRWGWWDRSPFTGDSRMHVSVWRKVPGRSTHESS
jgi:SAM-dependent methyltransferase